LNGPRISERAPGKICQWRTTVKQLILGVWWTTLPSPKNDATSGPTAKLPERPRSILDTSSMIRVQQLVAQRRMLRLLVNAVLCSGWENHPRVAVREKGGLFFAVFEFELEIPD
jgi:hypothetical protein